MKNLFIWVFALALLSVLASFTSNESDSVIWDSTTRIQVNTTIVSNKLTISFGQKIENITIEVQKKTGEAIFNQTVNLEAAEAVEVTIPNYEVNGNVIKVVLPETETQEKEQLEGEF